MIIFRRKNSGIRAHRRLLMCVFLTAFVFCAPFVQAHTTLEERMDFFAPDDYYKKYNFSDWDWMKKKLEIGYLFDYKTGSEFTEKQGTGFYILGFLAKLEIPEDAGKQEVKDYLLKIFEEYLNHPLIVELFKDLENIDGRDYDGGSYDMAIEFPVFIARTIIMQEPSPEELNFIWETFQKVQPDRMKKYHSWAFLKLLFFFNSPETTYQYCSMIADDYFGEQYFDGIYDLKNTCFIMAYGADAFFKNMAVEFLNESQSITNKEELDAFLRKKEILSYYSKYAALDRTILWDVFSGEDTTPLEKLLIISTGLRAQEWDNCFIPDEYEDYLAKNTELKQDKSTELLYQAAIDACEFERKRFERLQEWNEEERQRKMEREKERNQRQNE